MSTADPKKMFEQEAQDLLATLEAALLDLAREPGDGALIDTAFRALHTIKGSGAMFGFEGAAAFTHHVETAFDKVRQGKAESSPELIALALKARDHIQILIERPEEADQEAGEAILAGFRALDSDAPAAPAVAAAPSAPAAPGERTWHVRMRLARDVMANGTNPILLLDELRSLGTADNHAADGRNSPARRPRSRILLHRLGHPPDKPRATAGDRGRVHLRPRRDAA